MITIKKSNITFDIVYKEEYVPKDENFKKANCLILPYKNFREGVDYCFSEFAQEVLQYSKENSDGNSFDSHFTVPFHGKCSDCLRCCQIPSDNCPSSGILFVVALTISSRSQTRMATKG